MFGPTGIDRDMADIFLVQDEIVSQIVAKIAGGYGVIESTEAKSVARKNPNEIQAYDLVLRARETDAVGLDHETFRSARGIVAPSDRPRSFEREARRELAWLAVMGWVFRIDEPPEPPARDHGTSNQGSSTRPRRRTRADGGRVSLLSSPSSST